MICIQCNDCIDLRRLLSVCLWFTSCRLRRSPGLQLIIAKLAGARHPASSFPSRSAGIFAPRWQILPSVLSPVLPLVCLEFCLGVCLECRLDVFLLLVGFASNCASSFSPSFTSLSIISTSVTSILSFLHGIWLPRLHRI